MQKSGNPILGENEKEHQKIDLQDFHQRNSLGVNTMRQNHWIFKHGVDALKLSNLTDTRIVLPGFEKNTPREKFLH